MLPLVPSARDLTSQRAKLRREQESLLTELLEIVDALDRACEHWQTVEDKGAQQSAAPPSQSFPERLRAWSAKLLSPFQRQSLTSELTLESPTDLVSISQSAREGDELIRQTLLEVLERRNVKPIETCGQPFDPDFMHALGQEESTKAENTVVREIVRGYWWGDRVLRPAEVIVAVKAKSES